MLATLLMLLSVLVPQKADRRDSIELTSGKKVKGRVVLELDEAVVMRVGSVERKFARKSVKAVTSLARAHRKIHEELRKVGADPDALVALSHHALQAQLIHTANLLCYLALTKDAEHAEAHKALGHKQRRGKWLVPGRGGAMTLQRADKVRREWGKAWQLRSEHFAIRSSAGFASTVHALTDLEFFYLKFYDLFQKELELHEVIAPMRVQLYGKTSKFPKERQCFLPNENTLYVQHREPRSYALIHEGTHAMLFNTMYGAARSRGALPGWLDEGWAEYMTGVLPSGPPGKLRFVKAGRLASRLAPVAAAKRPFKLHRVLNFKTDDFFGSSKIGLKYGQSYALVHYMLHGATEGMRDMFFEYLRQARRGKGQASTFRRIFRRDLRAIETGHVAHARGQ